ncbi:MAG: tRNA (cytidine(34)-2'-O)-methyltransferase [Cyanobacteria bacterium J083]|nr:MAG: tRNA (cytidine(34)-2'-O)-methyltransferase [Cyanobacteria bacterium J083]
MPQLVLVEPQIPPNTGNIARTCAATGTALHLVGPLGFELSDRYLKRAGLDYWPQVNLSYYQNFAEFSQKNPGRLIGFSVRGAENYTKFQFCEDDWLLFGSETAGLSPSVIQACYTTVFIPIQPNSVRSLNLSVSAALGLFEARRQLGYLD